MGSGSSLLGDLSSGGVCCGVGSGGAGVCGAGVCGAGVCGAGVCGVGSGGAGVCITGVCIAGVCWGARTPVPTGGVGFWRVVAAVVISPSRILACSTGPSERLEKVRFPVSSEDVGICRLLGNTIDSAACTVVTRHSNKVNATAMRRVLDMGLGWTKFRFMENQKES